jgi:glycosyltransferase involved in cell wall biosynthesis
MASVSVIVPNFNHRPFLPRRLESILYQTLRPTEIVLLDDASTDGSRDVLRSYANIQGVRLIENPTNSGSAFKQWNRGIAELRGDYVWIAESDDFAAPRFLEVLADELDRWPGTGLAYCRSAIVDAGDRVLRLWRPQVAPARWDCSFHNSGLDECRRFLVFQNMIPNASAVLFRRDVFLAAGGAPEDVQITGDWLLWTKMLSRADVAYVAEPLSFFREHPGTVRFRADHSGIVLEENFDVLQHYRDYVGLDPKSLEAAFRFQVDLWIVAAVRYGIPFSANSRIFSKAKSIRRSVGSYLLARAGPALFHKAISRVGEVSRSYFGGESRVALPPLGRQAEP